MFLYVLFLSACIGLNVCFFANRSANQKTRKNPDLRGGVSSRGPPLHLSEYRFQTFTAGRYQRRAFRFASRHVDTEKHAGEFCVRQGKIVRRDQY